MSDVHELLETLRQKREEQQRLVEFRWCETIREAGHLYQETEDVSQVVEDLGLDEDRAREALKLFQLIYSYPLDVASTRGYMAGIRFFVRENSIEEVAEEDDWSVEAAKDYVREFVGALYQEHDLSSVELEDPPREFTGGVPAEKLAETIDRVDWEPVNKGMQRLERTLQGVLADIDFGDIIASIREHYLEVQQALENGIQNFDNPENYEINDVEIDNRAQQVGVESVASLLKDLEESDEEELDDYIGRIDRGLEAYLNEEFMLPCFIFISVQDGLMDILCSDQGKTPDGNGYYTSSQKRQALKEAYEEIDHGYYGVDADKIEANLEDFWDHRNAIMHGSLTAYFDENISTISLLFLMFTLYTILEVVYE